MNIKKITSITLAVFVVFSLYFISVNKNNSVTAQTVSGSSVTGWGWSSNIGWLKFSGSNYGVTYSTSTPPTGFKGVFSGYAWSSNIGWVKFDPVGPYPSSPNHGARLADDGSLQGWIRACAGAPNGDCSGTVAVNSFSKLANNFLSPFANLLATDVFKTKEALAQSSGTFVYGGFCPSGSTETLIQNVSVRSRNSISSTNNLPAGDYGLRASGVVNYKPNDGWRSDAKFIRWGDIGPLIRTTGQYMGLHVNPDPNNLYSGILPWGNVYNSGHVYTSFVDDWSGGPITFSIPDSEYSDNQGSISVDIYECGSSDPEIPPPPPAPTTDSSWDGWIKLSGSWPNGVTADGNDVDGYTVGGYAWGSDVVGWLRFGLDEAPTPPTGGGGGGGGCNDSQSVCIGGGGSSEKTVNVVTTGLGAGIVTGSGISCNHPFQSGDDCTEGGLSDEYVLTATPAGETLFGDWSGVTCNEGQFSLVCTIDFSSDPSRNINVIARFGEPEVVLPVITISLGNSLLGPGIIAVNDPGDGALCSTSVSVSVSGADGIGVTLDSSSSGYQSLISKSSGYGQPQPHFGDTCPTAGGSPNSSVNLDSGESIRFRMYFPDRAREEGSNMPSPYSSLNDYQLTLRGSVNTEAGEAVGTGVVRLRYTDERTREQ